MLKIILASQWTQQMLSSEVVSVPIVLGILHRLLLSKTPHWMTVQVIFTHLATTKNWKADL